MNSQRIIIGMGTGRCGTRSLAKLLSQQRDTRITHEERPLLPWRNARASVLASRLERMQLTRSESILGDVASFYLPYAKHAIEFSPEVRIVCLKRPREEVVKSFCDWLDSVHPLPTNHWAIQPAAGWFHEPVYTRMFPQYDCENREEGIRRYWTEYYQQAEVLTERFPHQVRIFDSHSCFNTEAGQRELLAFCGFERDSQLVVPEIHENKGDTAPRRRAAAHGSKDPNDPRRCVVLVPFYSHVDPPCDEALRELERRGYTVRRLGGFAAIDQARNKLATDALIDGFEETMWIDADVAFDPDSVDRLRRHQIPMASGVCPKKGKQELALRLLPGTKRMVFGKHGGLAEIMYAGTGFLHVRREVYERIQYELELPVCNERFPRPLIPFFQPLIYEDAQGPWYLGEDWSFAERARRCGFRIMADTGIRLWHIGTYQYGWEDAGNRLERYPDFTLNFPQSKSRQSPELLVRQPESVNEPSPRMGQFSGQAIQELKSAFPWPNSRPGAPLERGDNLLSERSKDLVLRAITAHTSLLVDLSAAAGDTTRFLAERLPHAVIIAIDSWPETSDSGQPGHARRPAKSIDTFLDQCWAYRDRVITLRMAIGAGLHTLVERKLTPDLIYLNRDDECVHLQAILEEILRLFPRSVVMGDGWEVARVCKAVTAVALEFGLRVEATDTAWRLHGLATGHTVIA